MDEKIITPEEFKIKMQEITEIGDPEIAHHEADELLCEALEALGYNDGVKAFHNVGKWYA